MSPSPPLLAASLFLTASIATAEPRPVTLDDLHRLEELSEPDLSPDGRRVAYTVTVDNPAADKEVSDLWLASLDGVEHRQLTHTDKESEWTPRFSPDGKLLAFLSDRDDPREAAQVWLLPLSGGEAWRLTDFPGGVSDFDWSPNGARLALIASDPEPEVDPPKVGKGAAEKKPKPIVITRTQFKEDVSGFLTSRRQHLYIFQIASREAVLLTPGDHDEWLPAFSPDGRSIAFVSKRGGDPDRHLNFDLFLVDPEKPGAERPLTHFPGSDLDPSWGSRPAWSPDGRQIAYLRSGEDRWIYYAPYQLAVVEVATGVERLPAPIDRSFTQPRWSKDGRVVFALIEESLSTRLSTIEVATGRVKPLTHGPRFDSAFDLEGEHLVLLSADDSRPAGLSRLELGTGAEPPLPRHNQWLDEVQLAKVEPIHFKSADGTSIDGFLTLPPGHRPGQRLPTILRIHGGPVYQWSHELKLDWQLFAARGYVVVAANPRGSSGRGFDFARAIYADWGGVDTADVLAAVDHAVALGVADPNRLGIGGWSYGGILTDFVIAKDTRFKAAVSGAGSANALATWGTDQYIREYSHELGTPWGNTDAYLRMSFPLLHADRIKTPTLFIVGSLDFNVPLIGSEQLYQALRLLEVPTELVIYPGQHHTITRPSFRRDRLERTLAWYGRFLGKQ